MNYATKLENWLKLSADEQREFLAIRRTNIVKWTSLSYSEKVEFLNNVREEYNG